MGACALMSPFAPHLKQRNPAMTRSRGLSVSEVQLSLLASPSSRLRMDPLDSISGACRTRSGNLSSFGHSAAAPSFVDSGLRPVVSGPIMSESSARRSEEGAGPRLPDRQHDLGDSDSLSYSPAAPDQHVHECLRRADARL